MSEQNPRPPARLRALVSWQANKVATLGARLTLQRMPATARADFAVLAALAEYGDLSQADIGRHLGLDRNDVSGIVTRLEAGAEVARRSEPGDRRRNVVVLVDAGAHRLDELQRQAEEVQDELLRDLAPAEREQLIALLDRVLSEHGALRA